MEKKLRIAIDAMEMFMKEYGSLYVTVWGVIYYVRPELRKAIIEKAPDNVAKRLIVEKINEFPYYGDVYASALAEALQELNAAKRERDH